jgi:aspartyl-tRNA synthetase
MATRTYIAKTPEHVDETVTIKGWVQNNRDMGQIAFLDVRDRTGLLQVVLGDDIKHPKLGPEYVVEIEGKVVRRGERYINKKMVTGEVEMQVSRIEVIAESKEPPFEIRKDSKEVSEEVRLKYRYMDLRTERMTSNLVLRHKTAKFIRDYLDAQNFIEVETPILTKGTPEGAREFLVPSRLHEGEFYVLPQSPQQFKQLLMVGGVDRYFQIVKCYRDEDQRGDRQPEFTQLDMEMSFFEQEDVLVLVEEMLIKLVEAVSPEKTITEIPFPRISYAESMEKYGNDKPDLRKDKNNPDELAFVWVLDFPMYEKTENKEMQAMHHPFTSPNKEDLDKLESDPYSVRSVAYDVALNGYEIGGGSVRITDPELQKRIFTVLGMSDEQIQTKFGHILEAFQLGVPPHAGLAFGFDRLVMLLANEPNIREVMAFPKTGDARDLMMGAPSEIDPRRLKEAHIKPDVK